MKKEYFGIFRRVNSETEGDIIEILKDPDFCRGEDKPFETFQTRDDNPFLPWLTTFKHTAIAQAELLTQIDGIRYFVGFGEVDFSEIAKNTYFSELVNLKRK